MYGPILGIEPKKVEVPEIQLEDEEEIGEATYMHTGLGLGSVLELGLGLYRVRAI